MPKKYQNHFEELGFSRQEAGFYGMIENIDDNMGKFFKQLGQWNLMENTIIIFTSDNGMTRLGCGLNGHAGRPQVQLGTDKDGKPMMTYNAGMKGLKGTVDEGGVRVPFLVQWDGKIKEGKTVDTVVNYLDIMPTLTDLCDAESPASQPYSGRSLRPLLFEKNPKWGDRFQFQQVTRWPKGRSPDDFKWKRYSVRNERFRLVEGILYDMENNPDQTIDVTAQHPELVSKMKSAYEKFWDDSRPLMINEDMPLAEKKPYHVDYKKQNDDSRSAPNFGGLSDCGRQRCWWRCGLRRWWS
ncbi:sulfatase-like hydrolase/transferase [Akkermansiaceae bacterium]|nr:sulfatase-like hydrolase/transferase [Akkermansiaceae bacterium]